MRRTQQDPSPSSALDRPRGSWLQPAALPTVGLDPRIWSQRIQQVALWRLIEAWHAGRRIH